VKRSVLAGLLLGACAPVAVPGDPQHPASPSAEHHHHDPARSR
jgi:hypothetical protein